MHKHEGESVFKYIIHINNREAEIDGSNISIFSIQGYKYMYFL